MKFNNYEIKKLFDYILTNKNIEISDNSLFNRDILITLNNIINGKANNYFELTNEQLKIIINAFISSDNSFNEYTPEFILNNNKCQQLAISRNIYSINFINHYTKDIIEQFKKSVLNQEYILSDNSPNFTKCDYQIIFNSIRKDVNSANYVYWGIIPSEEKDKLIKEIIKRGYLLSDTSEWHLKENVDVVLNSIKRDINTINYAYPSVMSNYEIFKYLMLHNYQFDEEELYDKPLRNFLDKEVMLRALKQFELYDVNNEEFLEKFKEYPNGINHYLDRFYSLFNKAINTFPKIRNFQSAFEKVAATNWEIYHDGNLDNYANIFGKICTELKNKNIFENAIRELRFLNNMKAVLGDKYNLLIKSMKEYHLIMHRNCNNKLDEINSSRDLIAKLSALYVSKSKEDFIKKRIEEYNEYIKSYFIPRKDHKIITKKIIEYNQKEKFKDLFERKDKMICTFLANIVNLFSNDNGRDVIWNMITNFVIHGNAKLDSFIKAPRGFNDYKRYLEASKLINRLNSKYIKYNDQELIRYLDVIIYDDSKRQYIYNGPTFLDESIYKYNEYKKKQYIFEKIKKEIIFKIKSLEINKKIDRQVLEELKEELPFNDEYFEFDVNKLEGITFGNFVDIFLIGEDGTRINFIEPSNIMEDEGYNLLLNYVIGNNLVWLLMFLDIDENKDLIELGFDNDSIMANMNYMYDIAVLAKKYNYKLNNFANIISLCDLLAVASVDAVAILGEDIINKLCLSQNYTNEEPDEIVAMACELICKMAKRDKSTVPYVYGRTTNYRYSIYDSQDETILLSGINTDACFRIDGNDNDFLHYCALDKNGFVIKITDLFGNFIARASGFRNGNCVFFNQLRTIYDVGGNGYQSDYKNEQLEIIDTFKKACEDIVNTSQNNVNEHEKIDFVFVTKSYALRDMDSNVRDDVEDKIGDNPMEHESDDWKQFVDNTKNLQECINYNRTFSTDYGSYSLICTASVKPFGRIRPRDIKFKDVDAVYTRPRNNIIATDKPNLDVINKVNRINGIYSYLNNTEFKPITISTETALFTGDNWYIAYSNGAISSSRVLDFDRKAQIEYEATKRALQEYTLANNKQINIEQVLHQFEQNNLDGHARILRLNH